MKSPWEKPTIINLVNRLNKIVLNVNKLENTKAKKTIENVALDKLIH